MTGILWVPAFQTNFYLYLLISAPVRVSAKFAENPGNLSSPFRSTVYRQSLTQSARGGRGEYVAVTYSHSVDGPSRTFLSHNDAAPIQTREFRTPETYALLRILWNFTPTELSLAATKKLEEGCQATSRRRQYHTEPECC